MRDWGPWVRWCRMADPDGDFCRICLMISRWWCKHVWHRNPTLVPDRPRIRIKKRLHVPK